MRKALMPAASLSLPRILKSRPTLTAVILAAVFAGIGYALRYAFVEPEAIGNMCKSAAAAWWCPIRTGFIVATEWNGLGYAATALAVVALVSAPKRAVPIAFVAMAIGGAALILYNATEAGPGLILALLRLAWIESRRA